MAAEAWRETRATYLGTEVDGKWWRAVRNDGLFVKGLGSYRLADGAFRFKRLLMEREVVIPLAAIESVGFGRWHAGQWGARKPILKVNWTRDGRHLSSGFGMRSREEAGDLQAAIEAARVERTSTAPAR